MYCIKTAKFKLEIFKMRMQRFLGYCHLSLTFDEKKILQNVLLCLELAHASQICLHEKKYENIEIHININIFGQIANRLHIFQY